VNDIPQKSYFRRIAFPLIVGTLFIATFLLAGVHAANMRSNLPDPFTPYDPATFGIPETLAGYRILAVTSSQNSPCLPANTQEVLIQAIDPMPENPMVARGNGDVIFELKKINPDVQWGLSYIMPVPFNRAGFASRQDSWNQAMKNGCIILGGPIIIITDTPDPFVPYAPATFGLPEIVAGYRIVTVQTSGNIPCMAVNQIRLTIQAVDPSPDNPMAARDGGDISFEVKKLHPDIDWQLQYIMPQPVNQIDVRDLSPRCGNGIKTAVLN
jgi:hypothetical protein